MTEKWIRLEDRGGLIVMKCPKCGYEKYLAHFGRWKITKCRRCGDKNEYPKKEKA